MWSSGDMRKLIVATILTACAPTKRSFDDQFPNDPFAFGCALPPVDVAELTPKACAIMNASCIDAAIGQCEEAKACQAALVECATNTQKACWDRL